MSGQPLSWLRIAQERQTQAVSTTVSSPFLLGPEPNKGMELTTYSVRSCLAVRRNSSNRIPDESGQDLEDILEVSRLTGAERQKGQAHGGKAGGAEQAQTAQPRKTCVAW